MLAELRIRNIAVIDAVVLPLKPALNVLTGETGAGKSLIVGALELLLGDRAAGDRLRAGADRGSVEGIFELGARDSVRQSVWALLDERGLDADGDTIVLKRELAAGGRSRGWINGTPVTMAVLAEVGARLVTVHGQHESQHLLEPGAQRDVLDRFAEAREAAANVQASHAELLALQQRAAEYEARKRGAERRADYLRFVVGEISAVKPVEGEDERVENEVRILSHAQEIRTLAAQAAAAVDGDERAALGQLRSVRRTLLALQRFDPDAERWLTALDSATYTLDELARELSAFGDHIEANPARLQRLETRRDALHQLVRKYGPTIADVLNTQASSQAELDLVDSGALETATLEQEIVSCREKLSAAAAALTTLRKAGAKRLSAAVSALLPELGMPGGQFFVTLESEREIASHGAEHVSFQVVLNAGSELRPLARVASGGELARVMLALSTVLARLQEVPTLVFDEVDAGVGGTVAWQVGALMRQVAGHHQVLAISHLAQIAARAHHHVVVRKADVGGVTSSDTVVVAGDERVMEIARMLGGDSEREVSRAHARELLDRGAHDVAELPNVSVAVKSGDRAAQRRGKRV